MMILLYKDFAKNFKKSQFAQKLKNGSDSYEHFKLSKV